MFCQYHKFDSDTCRRLTYELVNTNWASDNMSMTTKNVLTNHPESNCFVDDSVLPTPLSVCYDIFEILLIHFILRKTVPSRNCALKTCEIQIFEFMLAISQARYAEPSVENLVYFPS